MAVQSTGDEAKPAAGLEGPRTIKTDIGIAPASLAEDAALVARLTAIINAAYQYEAGLFWDLKWLRTDPDEVRALVRSGQLAVAWLEGSAQKEPAELVGCVQVKMVDTKTSEFGMLVCDASYRGTGIGRDLVQSAEDEAKQQGAEVMQLMLLYPDGWENESKVRLAKWYERVGYRLVRIEGVEDQLSHMAHLLTSQTVLRVYHKQV